MAGVQPSIGQQVGHYRIEALLGAGGMGTVYRAVDLRLDRAVALKVLQAATLGWDPQARERFRREARALARLNHPHIATVHDVGEQDGVDYLVMELVAGESLAERLVRGPLEVREATRVGAEAAEALAEAHRQGVIHRDMKPANVMVSPQGHAKVLDFGLAKLLAAPDATQSMGETRGVVGTPLYMSPEQVMERPVDARTDIWSLGALLYEALTGRPAFRREHTAGILRAITEERTQPVRSLRPEVPAGVEAVVERALRKEPGERYATAAEMAEELRTALESMSGATVAHVQAASRQSWAKGLAVGAAVVLVAAAAAGVVGYRRIAERRWALDEAVPQMEAQVEGRRPLAAFALLTRAERVLPGNAELAGFATENTMTAAVTSDPAGAGVEIQDYLTPAGPWLALGTTPLARVRIPKGYFRWRLTRPGKAAVVMAPETAEKMEFPLGAMDAAPAGMVYVPADDWRSYEAFIGWLGPYPLPAFDVDRYEVTNGEYQKFVDAGGYANRAYWPAEFPREGKTIAWAEGMAMFRDGSGRPGPATWAAGHYPEGKGDYPVGGLSWYEAAAYAAWAGKSLPVLGQWEEIAGSDMSYIVQESNIGTTELAAAGAYPGVGIYGTYDTAGNVREWVANTADEELRFILGGSWRSPGYLSVNPEALSPWDRSDGNGFRCVRNLGAVPAAAAAPVRRVTRDFAQYKPVSDAVFQAYELLYAYPKTALNAKVEGVVQETADWKEEKVTFDTAYDGTRMAAYLFLPKRVQPPYQTVLFFPSARVMFQAPDSSHLGDEQFFDYIVQSGRAVMYPVYQDTYERRLTFSLPGASQRIGLTTEWYKDAARALDYLATRKDIDNSRLAYLGVSMGAAEGVIVSTLLEDRLKTVIYLDGGYFMDTPPRGGDQADFVPRMKKPVLMVNGRYDYTFPVDRAQDPLFAMLGTPAGDKEHVVLETPHDVTEQRPLLVKAVLGWLDKYLGRVGETPASPSK
ncbi:MAG TPA: protein kinase [Acidobacteriaceae bacterium]|jgi:formylglycine-generating enzyme required for sulfatase activity/dienelactone hydrolase|nr:protein kinase [Acidobacteriaceae bacterium]